MDAKVQAGQRNEQNVAFYLKRRFMNNPKVRVVNDIKIEHDGETAQIDHLVLHKYGFIIIESKSIYGELKVNSQGEWSRSYKGQWFGMPSPIVQAQNQISIFKSAICEREKSSSQPDILDSSFMKKGFGGRTYHQLVAISSTAIVHRQEMPKDLQDVVVKAEFVPDAVERVIGAYSGVMGAITKSQPSFTDSEMDQIEAFLSDLSQQKPDSRESASENDAQTQNNPASRSGESKSEVAKKSSGASAPKKASSPKGSSRSSKKNKSKNDTQPQAGAGEENGSGANPHPWVPVCKHCSNDQGLEGRYGKYGYYFSCPSCNKNTKMQQPCLECKSANTRVSKRKNSFTLSCHDCHAQRLFVNQT